MQDCHLGDYSGHYDHYDHQYRHDNDDYDDDDIYIMMSVCLSVCNEKSSLPPVSLL